MLRYILLGILIYLLFKGIKLFMQLIKSHIDIGSPKTDKKNKYREMVKCSKCGVYIDEEMAEKNSGEFICSTCNK